jgi:hypothetical protein
VHYKSIVSQTQRKKKETRVLNWSLRLCRTSSIDWWSVHFIRVHILPNGEVHTTFTSLSPAMMHLTSAKQIMRSPDSSLSLPIHFQPWSSVSRAILIQLKRCPPPKKNLPRYLQKPWSPWFSLLGSLVEFLSTPFFRIAYVYYVLRFFLTHSEWLIQFICVTL